MEAQLIGYFPKVTAPRPEWLKAEQVLEVCSASTCVSEGPEKWIDAWCHNENWIYSTEEAARSVIDDTEKTWDLYAFKQYPVPVDHNEIIEAGVREKIDTELSEEYEFLGYDAVSRSCGTTFECSPLSCNSGAENYRTNRHCLFDSYNEALAGAKEFSTGGWEPGPYSIVEVFRKRRSEQSACHNAGKPAS